MTTAVSPSAAETVPGFAAHHADRWRKLQEERSFRLGQLAELDENQPANPRHVSVQKVLRASAALALAEIEAALTRLQRGTYGSCITCGRYLDAERLDILPMASLCMSCHYNEQNCHVAGSFDEAHAQPRS